MPKKIHGHNKTTKSQEGWNVVESRTKPSMGVGPRVNLNPQDFDNLILQQGVDVKVYRTSYCPNVKSVDGNFHNIDCVSCNGSGWLDIEPLNTKAVIQNISLEKQSSVEGFVDGNTVQMTFGIGVELQYFTLIEVTEFTEIFIQRVMRNPVGDIDIMKYRALRFNFVIDKNMKRYYQDQDFKIDNNGDILWITGAGSTKPIANLPYSVHYEASVQFRAIRAAHVNRFAQHKVGSKVEFIKLPSSWNCSKEFLLRRTDEATGTELKEGPFNDHTLVP